MITLINSISYEVDRLGLMDADPPPCSEIKPVVRNKPYKAVVQPCQGKNLDFNA